MKRTTALLWFATLLLWTPSAVAQEIDMTKDGWVFDVPETAGMGPDTSYAPSGYEQAIYDACAVYGCDGDYLISVMYCESGGDPNAQGAHGEIGLFQIKPWLWPQVDPWDPYDSIIFAASMFASGQGYNWECA